jgi:hypothetical protein
VRYTHRVAISNSRLTGPQQDLNLGIKTFLNGKLVSNIALDTSAVATDTIDYVATDSAGLTSTSTRTVIIEAAPSTSAPATTTPTTSPSTTGTTATSTAASSTTQ